jgi:hypothetical protein
MRSHINDGKWFSIDFDEWTSTANKRYINISVFGEKTESWSLGLVRLPGSGDADCIWKLVQGRLVEFGINPLTEIVGMVTDGAKVMKKVGRISEMEHQLCLCHGIQLAVNDVLYRKKNQVAEGQIEENVIDEDIIMPPPPEEDHVQKFNEGFEVEIEEIQVDFENIHVDQVIQKVRKIACTFKRSPTKNSILQKYVCAKHKRELQLMIDSKTRWSSLMKMLDRYLCIQDSVDKALIDIQSEITINRSDKFILNCLVQTLKPVALTVEVYIPFLPFFHKKVSSQSTSKAKLCVCDIQIIISHIGAFFKRVQLAHRSGSVKTSFSAARKIEKSLRKKVSSASQSSRRRTMDNKCWAIKIFAHRKLRGRAT